MSGKFIVLEGGEGAGKSTVARFLKEQLPKEQFLFTREPGGTPLAEKIRTVFISTEASEANGETELALVWAGRLDHVRAKITPVREAGKTVISERFDSSTYAYQIYGQEAPHLKPLFFEFRKLLHNTLPDIYIFLDVVPEEGLRRVRRSGKPTDHFEQKSLDFHKRVHEGYLEFFKTVQSVVVDANRPLREVQKDVLALVKKALA